MGSYDDVVENAKVTYVAGGAAQNAARSAAVSFSCCDPSPTLAFRIGLDAWSLFAKRQS